MRCVQRPGHDNGGCVRMLLDNRGSKYCLIVTVQRTSAQGNVEWHGEMAERQE